MNRKKSNFTFAMVFSTTLLMLPIVSADVFRSVDADGNVTYSDVPHKGAKKVEVQKPTIVPSLRSTSKLAPKKNEKNTVAYKSVKITSPANDETLRNIQSISVTGQVSPALQIRFGHQASFLFDGIRLGEPGGQLNATVNEVERGAHTLQLVILDRDGKVVAKSPVSQVFVHKNSIRNRPSAP